MKRVLLTGAGPHGFVGRNISAPLKARYELFTPSSAELDLCDFDALARYIDCHHIEAVVHGAAHSHIVSGAQNAFVNDLRMFWNLERLSARLEKIIVLGSGAEFDKRFPLEMIDEDAFGRSIPTDDYGFAKYIINKQVRKSDKLINLRLFGIYGPLEHWPSKFISNLCCKALFDLPLKIRQNCKFDFLYIKDLPQIIIWALDHETEYRDYNAVSGEAVTLLALAEMVCEVAGLDPSCIEIAKAGWNLPYTASNLRLKHELKTFKLTSHKEAISELYRYYRDNRDIIDYEILAASC